MRYVIFNDKGQIEGLYIEDLKPIPEDVDFALVTDELCSTLATKEVTSIAKKNVTIDKTKIYGLIDELVEENTSREIIVVDEIIDSEKLAIAEAIADLYQRMMLLEGGGSSGSSSY